MSSKLPFLFERTTLFLLTNPFYFQRRPPEIMSQRYREVQRDKRDKETERETEKNKTSFTNDERSL